MLGYSQEVFDVFYKALKGRKTLTYNGKFQELKKLYKANKLDDFKPVDDTQYVENIKNRILIRIKDKGQGMSKQAAKYIFDKFYREHTGDLHNVKGHGLGLAYFYPARF